ncbi:hypothetical protein H0O03_02705 [Candidatus Micrarchaeota archaeon]|nr:hypothetical protein [Candidatus Micrarchaeota archaeon]
MQRRSQASLEYLVVLAALFAFLAAFAPLVNSTRELAQYAVVVRTQESAFHRVVEACSQASVFGYSAASSREIILDADKTLFYYNESTATLSMSFVQGNRSKTLYAQTDYAVGVGSSQLRKGKYLASVVSTPSGIRLDFAPQPLK